MTLAGPAYHVFEHAFDSNRGRAALVAKWRDRFIESGKAGLDVGLPGAGGVGGLVDRAAAAG